MTKKLLERAKQRSHRIRGRGKRLAGIPSRSDKLETRQEGVHLKVDSSQMSALAKRRKAATRTERALVVLQGVTGSKQTPTESQNDRCCIGEATALCQQSAMSIVKNALDE
jgi:hypothetical protein